MATSLPSPAQFRVRFQTAGVDAYVSAARRRLRSGGDLSDDEAKVMAELWATIHKHDPDSVCRMQMVEMIDRLSRVGDPLFPRLAAEEWVRFSIGEPKIPQDPPVAALAKVAAAWRVDTGRPKLDATSKWNAVAAFAEATRIHVSSVGALKKQWQRWADEKAAEEAAFEDL